ncbi:MAG: hypothetical protein JSR67_01465 [Proteobacteria bacterium]|nr:hypothetical protein [Pseudomonadota bacterium]
MTRAAAAAALLLAVCLPALCAAEDLDKALRHCAQQGDPAQRLDCFDAVVKRLPQVEADRIGMTAEIRHQRDPAAVPAARAERLTAKIAGLSQTPYGELVFTLDNQQVWRAAEARPNMSFAVGEEVHIEHGAMSSLWLVGEKHRKLRVTRSQ